MPEWKLAPKLSNVGMTTYLRRRLKLQVKPSRTALTIRVGMTTYLRRRLKPIRGSCGAWDVVGRNDHLPP